MDPYDLPKPTPWDSAIYGIETFEVQRLSREALMHIAAIPGHYTAKIDPLNSKALLHEFGFYYCDTLIEPYCEARDLVRHERPGVSVTRDVEIDALLAICHGAFSHDRFHRDFNLPAGGADQRYDRWLRQLHGSGEAFGLSLDGALAGFIGLSGNRMVLHAVAPVMRGRGMAKFLWSAACRHFFEHMGITALESSVSAANLAAVNLYASLGFRFRKSTDVYHLLVSPGGR